MALTTGMIVVDPSGPPRAGSAVAIPVDTPSEQGVCTSPPLKTDVWRTENSTVTSEVRGNEVKRLHFVIETQRLINATTLDTEGVLDVVTERAQVVTDADGGVVELIEGGAMVYRAVSGVAAGSLGVRLDIDASLSGLCVREGVSLVCEDTETDGRVDRASCERVGVRSMIVVPLVHRGLTLGVLKVMSTETGHFTEGDMAILELLGGFIAASLANSFSFELEAHRALHDPLTGLPNRTLLMDRLEHELHQARRHGGDVALFFIDLDGFKSVNDELGHRAGDALLQALADELVSMLRAGDTLARFGGDEFVLLCPRSNALTKDQIRLRLDSAIDTVTAELGLGSVRFGASVGAAKSDGRDCTAEDLLKAADAAMYEAKRSRRVYSTSA